MKLLTYLCLISLICFNLKLAFASKSTKHHVKALEDSQQFSPIPRTLPNSGKSSFETVADVFSGRGMTSTEIKQVFRTIDKNFDNNVTGDEWGLFYKFFVTPFEKDCKPNEFYIADEKGFADCLGNSDSFDSLRKTLLIKKGEGKNLAKEILQVLFSDLNFADFVLLQRSQEAFENCADNGLIGKLKVTCGFQIALAGYKLIHREDIEPLFNIAIDLVRGRLKSPMFLDLPGFVNFVKLYSYYMEIDRPVFAGKLTKQDFRKGIQKRLFPIDITGIQLEKLLDLFPGDKMPPESFLLIVHSTLMFSFYDNDDNHFLNQSEFLNLFNDTNMDNRIKLQVDSFLTPTAERINEEENKSSALPSKESFILNFLEFHSRKKFSHRMKSYISKKKFRVKEEPKKETKPDPIENRKTMYNIFS